ncbi:MAG: hypothetical protein M3209_08685 [Acidobacteriota bacterium]|nr:hypothetical protein [Acidobacteriota bacterium]
MSNQIGKTNKYTNVSFEIFIFVFSLLPFLILACFYSQLPDCVPLFMNLRGEVEVWTDKNLLSVFRVPLMAVITQIFCLLMRQESLLRKTISFGNTSEEFIALQEKAALLNVCLWDWFRVVVAVKVSGASMFDAFLGFESLRILTKTAFILTGIAAMSSIVAAIIYGYLWFKVKSEIKAKFGDLKSQRRVEIGKVYGIFYFNPADSAIFHGKYTLNFGNKRTYVFIACIVLYPLLVFAPILK